LIDGNCDERVIFIKMSNKTSSYILNKVIYLQRL